MGPRSILVLVHIEAAELLVYISKYSLKKGKGNCRAIFLSSNLLLIVYLLILYFF